MTGMRLTQCQQDICAIYHHGKQKKEHISGSSFKETQSSGLYLSSHPRKIDCPQVQGGIMIMNGSSRFVTVKLLKNIDTRVVNKHMQEYFSRSNEKQVKMTMELSR